MNMSTTISSNIQMKSDENKANECHVLHRATSDIHNRVLAESGSETGIGIASDVQNQETPHIADNSSEVTIVAKDGSMANNIKTPIMISKDVCEIDMNNSKGISNNIQLNCKSLPAIIGKSLTQGSIDVVNIEGIYSPTTSSSKVPLASDISIANEGDTPKEETSDVHYPETSKMCVQMESSGVTVGSESHAPVRNTAHDEAEISNDESNSVSASTTEQDLDNKSLNELEKNTELKEQKRNVFFMVHSVDKGKDSTPYYTLKDPNDIHEKNETVEPALSNDAVIQKHTVSQENRLQPSSDQGQSEDDHLDQQETYKRPVHPCHDILTRLQQNTENKSCDSNYSIGKEEYDMTSLCLNTTINKNIKEPCDDSKEKTSLVILEESINDHQLPPINHINPGYPPSELDKNALDMSISVISTGTLALHKNHQHQEGDHSLGNNELNESHFKHDPEVPDDDLLPQNDSLEISQMNYNRSSIPPDTSFCQLDQQNAITYDVYENVNRMGRPKEMSQDPQLDSQVKDYRMNEFNDIEDHSASKREWKANKKKTLDDIFSTQCFDIDENYDPEFIGTQAFQVPDHSPASMDETWIGSTQSFAVHPEETSEEMNGLDQCVPCSNKTLPDHHPNSETAYENLTHQAVADIDLVKKVMEESKIASKRRAIEDDPLQAQLHQVPCYKWDSSATGALVTEEDSTHTAADFGTQPGRMNQFQICQRPLRVGLSRRRKLPSMLHLGAKSPYKVNNGNSPN